MRGYGHKVQVQIDGRVWCWKCKARDGSPEGEADCPVPPTKSELADARASALGRPTGADEWALRRRLQQAQHALEHCETRERRNQ